jgi:hypothetical protein
MAVRLPIQAYFKPKPTPTDWVRPVDWPVITDSPNEVQFLVADTGIAAFTIRTIFTKNSGTNIYIDWGDGTAISTISTATSTDTSHTYAIGTGTPCSRGYTTFKVRVYGDATCKITDCRPIAPVDTNRALYYNMGLLEVYYGDNTTTTNTLISYGSSSASGALGTYEYLEYIKYPPTVAWTQMTNFFTNCYNLGKVVLPTSAPNVTSFTNVFNNCYNIREILLPLDSTATTSMATAFINCFNLK